MNSAGVHSSCPGHRRPWSPARRQETPPDTSNVSRCTDTCERDTRGFCERDILVNETQLTCLPTAANE